VRFRSEVERDLLDHSKSVRSGFNWRAWDVPSDVVAADGWHRLDVKYWEPGTRSRMDTLRTSGTQTIKSVNQIHTARGKSPAAELYVDKPDGYAVVVKAGTNITKFGEFTVEDADYVEKLVYDEVPRSARLQRYDVLLASTGTGTLGKACVFNSAARAVADGHVTIVRCDRSKVDPFWLCDYLRVGFGHDQIERLYSGSTGLIELTVEQVDRVLVELPGEVSEQRRRSKALRLIERRYMKGLVVAERKLSAGRETFEGP
jgi:type I restriction enzyme M protein